MNLPRTTEECLTGDYLYGDDFSQELINQWYEDEAEAYADLAAASSASKEYHYRELNHYHAWSAVMDRHFRHGLGLGSAYGDEFEELADRIDNLTILEPSEVFAKTTRIHNIPCKYIKPRPDGLLAFDADTFDLISCLGVLHHIPNVSTVLNECYRCLKTAGVMAIREPITTMGDWRAGRRGLTKRERGLPIEILERILCGCGFKVLRRRLCMCGPFIRACRALNINVYDSRVLTRLDHSLSSLLAFNLRYHRTSIWDRFAAGSVFFLVEK